MGSTAPVAPSGTPIFLSYSSTDSAFALKLAADLKNAGVQLWMERLDQWSPGTIGGEDWKQLWWNAPG